MDFIEEVKWRGMVHQMMPGTEEKLKEGMTTAYIGIAVSYTHLTLPTNSRV